MFGIGDVINVVFRVLVLCNRTHNKMVDDQVDGLISVLIVLLIVGVAKGKGLQES